MIALLDNVQILVISKKLVNKLHSLGFVTSLWLSVTQRITNEISNFVTYSRHSSPIFKFWENGFFIYSIDRVLIADLRNI